MQAFKMAACFSILSRNIKNNFLILLAFTHIFILKFTLFINGHQ